MPLELHIENANLSESHYSSLLITGVAQHRLGIRGRQFSGDGQSGQRYEVGAVYVFLKPPTGWSTVNETAKLTASDLVYPGLGVSVAIDGNAVAPGVPFWYSGATRPGAIYLFVRPATGWRNMTQTFKRIGVPYPKSSLGQSVAFGGNTTVENCVHL